MLCLQQQRHCHVKQPRIASCRVDRNFPHAAAGAFFHVAIAAARKAVVNRAVPTRSNDDDGRCFPPIPASKTQQGKKESQVRRHN